MGCLWYELYINFLYYIVYVPKIYKFHSLTYTGVMLMPEESNEEFVFSIRATRPDDRSEEFREK